jgi:hypothetical protein
MTQEENTEDSFELIERLKEVVNKLNKKAEIAEDLLDLISKERTSYEHKYIEFVELEDLTDEYKIATFDELRRILLKRRVIKNETVNLKNNKDVINNIIDNTNKLHMRTHEYIDKVILSTESSITQTVPEEFDTQNIKEYPYKTDKQRIGIMRDIEHKFDKIINLENEKKLVCYKRTKKAC